MPGDFHSLSIKEIAAVVVGSASMGIVRFLYLLRQGRKFVWFDVVLEPCLAVIGGMLMWGVNEATGTPDVMQAVFTCLGAWGGPRTIQWMEKKHLPKDEDK